MSPCISGSGAPTHSFPQNELPQPSCPPTLLYQQESDETTDEMLVGSGSAGTGAPWLRASLNDSVDGVDGRET